MFNDRLITFEVSFTIAHLTECTEEIHKINPAALPVLDCNFNIDLENYLKYTDCKSLLLDGVNEYINCTNNSALDIDVNGPVTFAAWIKADSLSLLNFMITKFTASLGWEFTLLNGTIRLIFSSGFGTTTKIVADGTAVINTGEWYHLAATYDGSNSHNGMTLYINSVIDPKTTSAGGPLTTIQNPYNLHIGGQAGFYFNGNIASARMWKTELSAAEILEEYNSGKIKNVPVNLNNIILNTDLNCAKWNGAAFEIPDLTGITTGYISVNSEESDLLTDCP